MSRLSRFIHFYTDEDDGNGKEEPYVLKTIKAAIVHITDALAKPAVSVKAYIEPIQDLHGQDAPYPAGGGVNKINFANCTAGITAFGLTSAISGEYVRFTGTCSSGGSHAWKFLLINSEQQELAATLSFASFFISGGSGLYISQTFINDDGKLTISIGGLVTNQQYDFTVGIVGYTGTEPTSWSPYSNICPITGHTGASVVRTGKNLTKINAGEKIQAGVTWVVDNDGTITSSGTSTGSSFTPDTIKITLQSGTYTASLNSTNSDISAAVVKNGAWFRSVSANGSTTFTLEEEAEIYMYASFASGKNANGTTTIQLESGSTASDYEAYQGTTIPITFPDAAGTVYGGTLTHEGGEWKLSVTMASVDMGTLTWGKGTESDKPFFLTESLKDVIKQIPNNTTKATIKTPIYITTSYWGGNPVPFMNTDFDVTQTSGSHQIRTRDSRYSTEQEYKTAMSGVQLVYELATPITYTLTESQALTLLKGENVVWCDGSDDLELQYYAKAEETP